MNAVKDMTLTVTFTDEYAERTGTATVTRRYVGEHVTLMGSLEDLLAISGATGADVMRVDLS